MPDIPLGAASVAPGSSFRFSTHRKVSGGKTSTFYPNPFFDIAQTYMPSSTKDLFRWCRYYAMTNPLISTVLYKVSSYPITDVLYDTTNDGLRKKYAQLFEDHFKIRPFIVEANLDRNTYGNAFISVSFPFRKYLKCKHCKHAAPVDRTKYRFRNYDFYITCAECGYSDKAIAEDRYNRALSGIKLVRWNPQNITINFNEVTGKRIYYYAIPRNVKNDIIVGRAQTVETIPQQFIDALKKKKSIVIREDQIFHSKRPSISRPDAGWGMPMLLPVLKDVFYLQVLKKAQEAIFFGYITPMRVLYPAPQTGSSDPYQYINLSNWKTQVASEVQEHRRDPNYMPIMPIPLGYQNVGGEGKALMLSQEIRVWSEHIVAGMGVPPELVFSGLSWSGSSVSLRMLENEFIGNREDNEALLRFIVNKVSSYLGWQKVGVKFKPFKMADDLQRSAFDLQLASQKMLSKKTLLESRDHDYDKEKDQVKAEMDADLELARRQATYQAETQGRGQVTMAKYQAKTQTIMGEAQQDFQQKAQQGQAQQPGAAPQQGPPQQGGPQGAQQGPPQQGPPQQGGAPPDQAPPQPGGAMGAMQSPINAAAMEQAGPDMQSSAQRIAQQISSADASQQGMMLSALKIRSPDLYAMVLQFLNQPQPGKPLPQQRPPQRGPGTAQV